MANVRTICPYLIDTFLSNKIHGKLHGCSIHVWNAIIQASYSEYSFWPVYHRPLDLCIRKSVLVLLRLQNWTHSYMLQMVGFLLKEMFRVELNMNSFHGIYLKMIFIFSCDQAALWMVFSVRLSVCPSVCPSVTPFWLCYHHRIIMKFSGVITLDQGKVHAKGQGQRSKVKVTEVTTQIFVSGL